jgi:hypothetical protein
MRVSVGRLVSVTMLALGWRRTGSQCTIQYHGKKRASWTTTQVRPPFWLWHCSPAGGM